MTKEPFKKGRASQSRSHTATIRAKKALKKYGRRIRVQWLKFTMELSILLLDSTIIFLSILCGIGCTQWKQKASYVRTSQTAEEERRIVQLVLYHVDLDLPINRHHRVEVAGNFISSLPINPQAKLTHRDCNGSRTSMVVTKGCRSTLFRVCKSTTLCSRQFPSRFLHISPPAKSFPASMY